MKILFYRYGSICEPDIIDAFRRLGFEVDEDTREIYDKKLLPSDCINGIFERTKTADYSFVFSINFFPSVSEVCNIVGIPYLCIVVDSPVLELFSTSLKNDCNNVFIFDRQLFEEFRALNENHIFHIPLATNVRRNYEVCSKASYAMRERYKSDVSFIGSLYTEKCAYNNVQLPVKSRGYVDGLIDAQLKIYGYNFIEECLPDWVAEDFINAVPALTNFPETMKVNVRSDIAQHYISVKAAEQERIRLLKTISSHFNTDIYTGSDTSGIPLVHNRGLAKTAAEMPLIFNNSKINLNITARSIRSGLSLRIFDVLGCNGFLITNYQEELPEYFSIGEDLEAFASEDELISKIEYYLVHENERNEIAQNGFEKVKSLHNWEVRITQILETAFGLK